MMSFPSSPLIPAEWGSKPRVGDLLDEFSSLAEPERRALWRSSGGADFPGPVGPVRRLARVVPLAGHPLPFKIPFLFTMDGPGVYFGDDVEGLWRIFGGQSALTRLAWGRLLMKGRPGILVCDVALGRTSFVAEHQGLERALHVFCAWARVPVITPARAYYALRRAWRRLDSYEVRAVAFFPPHGCYSIVLDPRRIVRRALFASIEAYRASVSR